MEFNLHKSFDSAKREYSYRTESQVDNLIPDTFIDPSDPIHQLKQLSGIANPGYLQEYKDPGETVIVRLIHNSTLCSKYAYFRV